MDAGTRQSSSGPSPRHRHRSTLRHLPHWDGRAGPPNGTPGPRPGGPPVPTVRVVADETPTRLTVLLVVEASFAGVGRHVLDLADGLTARGVVVDVLYGQERAEPGFV